ncbi:hypothetical protein BST11_15070 [Mycobacterium alsense]|uniref:peptidyl-tRNA hydrolase n=1 Tax=Mycobacterium alsense TaxID=324058 RepID=A0ABX3R7I9_9MYCO|nr:peptidyl-tRNA hydrolase [Mycobacterium alsense]OQZ90026.1 hypothetical protein BST11_15070 [Mycobacterium alsense]
MLDLRVLLESWLRLLRTEEKSPKTIAAYREGVQAFITRCEHRREKPALTRDAALAFVTDMMDAGLSTNTIRLRLIAVKQFAKWVSVEEEVDVSRLLAVRPPRLTQGPVPALPDEDVLAMLRACAGNFTKICVRVESEQELVDVVRAAESAGLLNVTIRDNGKTEFGGVPTLTCAAIGPDTDENLNPVTGDLKLLQ